MMSSLDLRVLPSATADLRGQTVLSLMAMVGASFDWQRSLAVTAADMPTAYLPYAIRQFGIQDYVQPGMREDIVRRLVEHALLIKVREGTISGVRAALSLVGMKVRWTQWHEMTPIGAPGTHRITVYINEFIFENQTVLLDERIQRAADRIIAGTKRHSQTIEFLLGIALASSPRAAAGATHTEAVTISGRAITQKSGSARPSVVAAAAQAERVEISGPASIQKYGAGVVRAAAGATHAEYIEIR